MRWDDGHVIHSPCAVFYKVEETWGELSNMNNNFPLSIGNLKVKSSEALYQACRFPHEPAWQQEILEAKHAFAAKLAAKRDGRREHYSRADFEQVKEELMRWCLKLKLFQHAESFGAVLLKTKDLPIVERSRRDTFWGAKLVKGQADLLKGENKLGLLLMELRAEYKTWLYSEEPDVPEEFECPVPAIPNLKLEGRPISEWLENG